MSIADDVYKAVIKKVPNAVRKYGAEALGSAILRASRKDTTDIEKLADAVIKSLKPKTNEEKNKPTLTDDEEKQILSKLLKVFNSVSSPEQLKSAKKYHSLALKKLSAKSLDEFHGERGEIGDLALKISSAISNKEKKYTPVDEGQIYSTGGGAGQSYRKFTPKVDKTLDEDWGSSDWTAALKDFKRDLEHVKNADDIADSAYSIASSFNEPRKYSDDPWTNFTPKRLLDMALRREIVPKELISTVQGILSGKIQVRIAHELDEEVLIKRLSQESSIMKGLVAESKCPKCGGPLVSEEMLHEKKDACYYKVKSRYKVWPSAYASGALVKCRKKGAKNWGNKSVKENKSSSMPGTYEQEYNMFKSKGPERIIAMTNEADKDVAEGKKRKKKKTSRSLGRYFFPGYGYYGSGESGESGSGDGGGGESVNRGVAEGEVVKFVKKSNIEKYSDAFSKQHNDQHRYGVGEIECPYCGSIDCDYDCDESQADGFNENVKIDELKCWPGYHRVKGTKAGAPGSCAKNTSEDLSEVDSLAEDLHKWFKEKWVRFGPDGKIRGDCARGSDSEGKPKCLPQKKAHALGKKGRASAAARKRRQDPNPERKGKAKNVPTKKKK